MIVLLLLLVLLVCAGLVWIDGMWGAVLKFFCAVLSGLIATNFFRPVASQLDGLLSNFTYFWDYLALWLLFAISFGLLHLMTGMVSKHRVRFVKPVEMTGRTIFAVLTAWVMVCFVCFSLHVAPLSVSPFFGSFQSEAGSRDFIGMAPDQQWMALVYSCSSGSLSALTGTRFEPPYEFISTYRDRRASLQKHHADTGSFLSR